MPRTFPEMERQVCALYEAGYSISEVSKYMPYTPGAVWYILDRHEIPRRPRAAKGYRKPTLLANNEIDKTVKLYRDLRLSLDLVARLCGVSPNAIRYRLQIAGVPIRSRTEAQEIAYQTGRKRKDTIFGRNKERAPLSRGSSSEVRISRLSEGRRSVAS